MRETGEHWLAVGRMSNAARTEFSGLGTLCDEFKRALYAKPFLSSQSGEARS